MTRTLIAILAITLAITPFAQAVVLEINDGNADNDGKPFETFVPQGQEFQIDVVMHNDGPEDVLGLSVWLEEASSAGFTIKNRTVNTTVYDEWMAVDPVTGEMLSPVNDQDLGMFDSSNMGIPGPFTQNLMTIVLDTDGVAPGTYTINTAGTGVPGSSVWMDSDLLPQDFDQHGSYTVTVPEPSTIMLLMLLCGLFIYKR